MKCFLPRVLSREPSRTFQSLKGTEDLAEPLERPGIYPPLSTLPPSPTTWPKAEEHQSERKTWEGGPVHSMTLSCVLCVCGGGLGSLLKCQRHVTLSKDTDTDSGNNS